jgi:Trk-type K+ transport system membrane component
VRSRLIFVDRQKYKMPWRSIASFVAGVLVASLFLGMTKAHSAEKLKVFVVEHNGMTKSYQVVSCVRARAKIVQQRTRGALGIKFFCDGRRI